MMRFSTLLIAILGAAACGKVVTGADGHPATVDAPAGTPDAPSGSPDAPAGTPDAAPTVTTFTNDSMWNCASGIDCEDVYDFDVAAGTQVTATVTLVTGASTPRLGLFAGAGATSGTNLFNNAATAVCSAMNKQDVDLTGGPVTVGAGHYRLTVGRDWGFSAGAAGTYTITLRSSAGLSNAKQTADDTASNQAHCP